MFVVTVKMCNISCFIASVKDIFFGEILGFGGVHPHVPHWICQCQSRNKKQRFFNFAKKI